MASPGRIEAKIRDFARLYVTDFPRYPTPHTSRTGTMDVIYCGKYSMTIDVCLEEAGGEVGEGEVSSSSASVVVIS